MESRYMVRDHEDSHSHNPRSRASSSGVSTTSTVATAATAGARLQALQLAESPITVYDTASYTSSRPPSSQGIASPAYLGSPLPQQRAAFLSTPIAQQASPSHLPLLPERGVLDVVDWFETPRHNTQSTPLFQLGSAPAYSNIPSSSPSVSSSESETMSAVAIPYDPGFSMTSRSTLAWPVMESSSGLLSHDPSSYTSDASLTPSSASRSVTASPPRGSFTTEQRELKRQRDQVRRDNKMQVRSQRTGSGSSMYSNPVSMSDITTGASALPIYTTAPSGISLLAESQTPYLSSFSPPVQTSHSQANMFPASYPQSPYMSEYTTYPSTSAPSLPSQYGYVSPPDSAWADEDRPRRSPTRDTNSWHRRPMMPTDPSMMYSVPSVMTGPPAPQDPGHVRVVQVQNRPKPQCWEHGCNGRQFSTFSNLLRHQREKSGQAAKATCPHCGAEFTRTTARNGHVAHDKCKSKRNNSSGGSS